MRYIFVLGCIWISFVLHGQSPFNYGQNRHVYFISAEQRSAWQMDTLLAHDTMQVSRFTYNDHVLRYDWFAQYYPGSVEVWIDSLYAPWNGCEYTLADNGRLALIEGGGYGSFDRFEFMYRDGRCFVARDCVGHCSNQPTTYSEILYNENGLPWADIRYTALDPEMDLPSPDDDSIPLDSFLLLFQPELADTSYILYNKGLFWKKGEEQSDWLTALNAQRMYDSSAEERGYVSSTPMERFFQSKIGYKPDVVLIEYSRELVIPVIKMHDGFYNIKFPFTIVK